MIAYGYVANRLRMRWPHCRKNIVQLCSINRKRAELFKTHALEMGGGARASEAQHPELFFTPQGAGGRNLRHRVCKLHIPIPGKVIEGAASIDNQKCAVAVLSPEKGTILFGQLLRISIGVDHFASRRRIAD